MTSPHSPSRTSPGTSVIIPAATAVIFRHAPEGGAPELLMVQRSAGMRFAGGASVFPGGRVDPADIELAASLAPALSASPGDAGLKDVAARIAAIRETLEETGLAIALDRPVDAGETAEARLLLQEGLALGLVLERMGWRLDLGALVPFARWCPLLERAFDTRFYLFDLGTGAVDLAVDATENSRLFWISADDALAAADTGEISLIFPTRRNLERLTQFTSFTGARDHALETPVRKISPALVEREGETWLMIPENMGYPVLGEPLATVKRG